MRRPTLIIILLVAMVTLVLLSLCPWHEWTGGRLKNFNLLSDLLPAQVAEIVSPDENIDPELKKLLEEPDDTISDPDSIVPDAPVIKEIPDDFKAPLIDGNVAIEDYSIDDKGLERLASTLSNATRRKVRIAMIGDSYIEGDILAQDIRAGLQTRYGGHGVGYMAAFSAFPGFRSSVNQTASGWEGHEIAKMKDDPLRTIYGSYFTSSPGANARFRKSVKPARLESWGRSSVMFLAKNAGSLTVASPDFEKKVILFEASPDIQFVSIDSVSGDVRFTTDVPDLNVLGFWLEDISGISLDGISLRGNSGLSHRQLNATTTAQMRRFIDYDLIILEFGLNVLSATQSNYSKYADTMVEVVNNLKTLYPNAQILIFGVGDRGQKSGTEVISMPTINALVKAQRDVARRTESLFWDMREAMGGVGAAVDWHSRKLLNSDYVHLNHRGGKELAEIFLNSLDASIK